MEPDSSSPLHSEWILRARRQVDAVRDRSPRSVPVGLLREALRGTGSGVLEVDRPPGLPGSIPGYEFQGEIHRGGQGVVLRARQKATGQTVAIKVMSQGPFLSARDRARFEQEVHILGQLRHPHIVHVIDCGSFEGGFYFVMEYIDGRPLDQWVAALACGDGADPGAAQTPRAGPGADGGPTAGAREYEARSGAGPRTKVATLLRLFARVCDAVNAAHLHGVIHRDLKPGNILVDRHGEPRILDFGLAKLASPTAGSSGPGGDADAAMTATGQFVGSLPWASPEQAVGEADIDVRTDVYSLGVILYQLLTGRFPYEVFGNVREVLNRICAAEPQRPSTLRGSDGRPLRHIDRDLETIVLKCLAKQRQRRYQSAGQIATDLDRYLAGLPIEARRDSLTYVLSKQLRRHKLPVALSAVLLAAIVTGLLGSVALWRQAEAARQVAVRQRDEIDRARRLALEQHQVAERARQEAERRRANAETITRLLTSLLGSSDPRAGRGRDYTVRQLLDDFAAQLADQLQGQPEVEADIRTTMGNSYLGVDALDSAAQQFERVLELRRAVLADDDPLIAEALGNLAAVRKAQGDYARSEELYRRCLAVLRRAEYPPPDLVAASLNQLASVVNLRGDRAEARRLLTEAVAIRRGQEGGDESALASALNNLAMVMVESGELADAQAVMREVLEIYQRTLGPQHPHVATALSNLAEVLRRQGEFEEAEALHRQALELRRQLYGERQHSAVAGSLNNLGLLLRDAGRAEEALPLLEQAADVLRAIHGERHPNLAICLNNIALTQAALDRLEQAEQTYRRSLRMQIELSGQEHPETARTMANLADVLRRQGRCDEAEPLARGALDIRRQLLGAQHPDCALGWQTLGVLLSDLGRLDEAEAALREALRIHQAALGDDHPRVAGTLSELALVLLKAGRLSEAEHAARQALDIRGRRSRPGDWQMAYAQALLGRCLAAQQLLEQAEPLVREACQQLSGMPAAPRASVRQACDWLAELEGSRSRPPPVAGPDPWTGP